MRKLFVMFLLALKLMVWGQAQTIPFDESQYIVKDVTYDYDLVSGKVNEVIYQEGEADELKYGYEYDGDNRITAVYTSIDGINWIKEANYEYYAHGPLAKTELGEQKVEIQNYAYTLQGWVKGVQGQNFSYGLGYNGTDYQSISSTDPTGGLLNTTVAIGASLYNGNIATWHTNTPALAVKGVADMTNQYSYDQLNRIKSSTVVGKGSAYKTGYQYDANGNILALQRYNEASQKFDAFKYNYESKGAGYLSNTNKLRSVDDTVTNTSFHSEDLEDQDVDNYQYDDIGNLNFDRQEDIDKIEWTVYSKVKAVYRKTGSLKPNLLFEYDASGNRVSKTSIANNGTVSKTFYIRDAVGNVLSTYVSTGTSSLTLQEQYLYGSSRLGVLEKGNRSYELTDHLGNVHAVVNEFNEVKAAYEYYAFGMSLAKIDNGYRYGFNGQEKVSELDASHTTAMYWEYDGRICRRWNIDPKTSKYPAYSAYHAFNNNPIYHIDPTGAEPPYGDGTCKDCVADDGKGGKTITSPDGQKHNVGKATNILTSSGVEDSKGVHFQKGAWGYTNEKGEQYLWNNINKRFDLNTSDRGPGQNKFPIKGQMGTTFAGGENPINKLDKTKYDYSQPPLNLADKAGYDHDKSYDKDGLVGTGGVINPESTEINDKLIEDCNKVLEGYKNHVIDPYTGVAISKSTAAIARAIVQAFVTVEVTKGVTINPPYQTVKGGVNLIKCGADFMKDTYNGAKEIYNNTVIEISKYNNYSAWMKF